jgi:hypothetical protein
VSPSSVLAGLSSARQLDRFAHARPAHNFHSKACERNPQVMRPGTVECRLDNLETT